MFFNLIFFIYVLLYFPYLILTGRWYKGYGCRLGFLSVELRSSLSKGPNIWIHAVSVGEIMAISSLIPLIKSRFGLHNIVVTTTTKTGFELAQSKLAQQAIILPSPLDFTWVVSAFVRLINPRIYIVAETEIWPNLFNRLNKQNIPIVIINGRISDVSLGRYQMIKPLLKRTLEKVSLFCMQSHEDARRIMELGAPSERVSVLGNIKFDDASNQNNVFENLIPSDRLWWIAGSTHPGEEEILLKVVKENQDNWGLVIAPRHVERTPQVMELVQASGFKALKFSQLAAANIDRNTVIVVDTIGQLKSLYKQASLVFVGKSLCGGGGQNIIEPACYAKPIIIGPLMQNFRDITAIFKAQNAIVQVGNVEEFETEVKRLMKDAFLREQLGQKALAVVKANQGAGVRTLKMLEKWL